ncbi:Endonuclease YncB, thermonuclease family [Desulfacinum hydrothermale DSM 13146]|uniref:Endonuclease YncB, thermonuclease family n=1 Tax=Desulfacinum hydrothermale DSM 13146 TaxID=1121390 RepID=A0A1W1XQ23_9BACT|nr:thermonuclease family protein [Desulfacinum hydrothermale]SMC25996.1 Endonuclease YncB, thermonuclease family [Desulfacinum hydrothermale DSM 13146]
MKSRFFLIFFLGLLGIHGLMGAGSARAWEGPVVKVHDGDTLTVLRGSAAVRIRLYGVDCPEKSQEFGPEATAFVRGLVQGRLVSVFPVTRDRYGRTVAVVQVGGVLLNEEVVAAGYGWVYRRYCREAERCRRWLHLEEGARERAQGLWAAVDPVPPWEFRHGRRLASASVPSAGGPCRCHVDMDCKDFMSWQEAQACFEECLRRTGRDVHRLDRDGDGRVCEGLR